MPAGFKNIDCAPLSAAALLPESALLLTDGFISKKVKAASPLPALKILSEFSRKITAKTNNALILLAAFCGLILVPPSTMFWPFTIKWSR
ncbi:MAG: hypothetical protein PF545_03105 [Elusimicrobia bacterium]|jgi:hypothetical protein|nr:hypothetical protein [Elusimicrobiota bacterium]